MAKTWLTADWHLGEDRMHLMQRPFNDPDVMGTHILRMHNSVVKPEDELIIVGDVVYKERPEYLKYLKQFNGRKTLIRGNHDRVFTDADLKEYFEEVVPEGSGLVRQFKGYTCWLTHYPTKSRPDMFNLVGHIHAAWQVQLNCVNVGVDVHHFYPVDSDQVEFYVNAISKFYDDDVWMAYKEANMQFLNLRGKKGSYFDVLSAS